MFVNWYLLSGATNSLLRRPISLSLQEYFNRFLLLLFLCLCAQLCVYVFMSVCLCAFVFVRLCVFDCVCGYIRVFVRLRRHLLMSIFYYCVFLLLLSLGTSQTASRSIIRSKYFHPQPTRVVNIQIILLTSIWKIESKWIYKKQNISQAKLKTKKSNRCQYCSDENENSYENKN